MNLIRSTHVRLIAVLLFSLSMFGLVPTIPTASADTPTEVTDVIESPNDDLAPAGYVPISSHTCVDYPFTAHHSVLIYAYPSDKPNQQATEVPRIREQFAYAQDILYASAKRRGAIASYKTNCNAQLQPEVLVIQLPTSAAQTTFESIKTDLIAKGYTRNTALYLVDFDGSWTACGKANGFIDETPGSTNAHNQGARFGVSFKTLQNGALTPCNVLQHEAAHLMGAVQNGAPTSNHNTHCTDGVWNDILCNGPQQCPGTLTATAKAFDCNNDDYFDPHAPAGSYLANNWNLGGCAQLWIELSSCPSELGTVTYDSAHPSITYTGPWTHQTGIPNTIGNTLSSASQINAGASLTFVGNTITVFYSMGSTADRMGVFIDNQSQGSYQAQAAEIRRQVAHTHDNLGPGPHTIYILHSPTNGGSTSLDAFAVNIARVGTGSYDNTHAHLRYTAAWTHATPAPGAFNDTLSWSRDATEVVRFTFVGNTLRYVYDKAPNRGIALITIDGIPQANIDQYYPTTVRPIQTTYSNLGPGTHVVTISPAGYTRPGIQTSPYITIDRFIVEP